MNAEILQKPVCASIVDISSSPTVISSGADDREDLVAAGASDDGARP